MIVNAIWFLSPFPINICYTREETAYGVAQLARAGGPVDHIRADRSGAKIVETIPIEFA